jgi:prepilin-type N-terminal cleavage/methylation domain-containing protein
MSRGNQGGFTLLEMVLVVAILVIVAGAVVTQLSGTEDQAKSQIAQGEMATLRDACIRWKEAIGTFPGTPSPPSLAHVTPATSAPSLSPLVELVLGAAASQPVASSVALVTLPDPNVAGGQLQVTVPPWNRLSQRGWSAPFLVLPSTLTAATTVGTVPGAGAITLPEGLPARLILVRVNADGTPSPTPGGTPTYVIATPFDLPPPSGFDPTDATQRSYYWYTAMASVPAGFAIATAGATSGASAATSALLVSYP